MLAQEYRLALETDVIDRVLQHDLVLADVVQAKAFLDIEQVAARGLRQASVVLCACC
jgi:hypothetical protein